MYYHSQLPSTTLKNSQLINSCFFLFQDPFYLQFRFKPDCNLHDPDTKRLPPQQNPSTTSTPRSTSTVSTTTIHRLKNTKPKRNPVVGTTLPNSSNSIKVNSSSFTLCLLLTTFVSWFLLEDSLHTRFRISWWCDPQIHWYIFLPTTAIVIVW